MQSTREQLAQQVQQLAMLRQIALAITSETDREKLLELIVRHAVALLQAKSGGVYGYDPLSNELAIIADWGRDADLNGHVLHNGEGMAGYLISSGADYLIVDNYNESPYRASIYRKQRIFGAVIEVPLRWYEQTIGVLYVDDIVGRMFTDDDVTLLQLFADPASIALGNAQAYAQNRMKVRRLEQLAAISNTLIGGIGNLSLQDWFNHVVHHVTTILDAEASGIFLVDHDHIVLRASYGHAEGHDRTGMRLPIKSEAGGGLTSHIAATGEVFCAAGVALREHVAVRGEMPHARSMLCNSVLAVPLYDHRSTPSRYLGLLRADNKNQRGAVSSGAGFSNEDTSLLLLFADLVVTAIQVSALVEQLKDQTAHSTRLIETAPVGIVVNDLSGAITAINRSALDMLGSTHSLLGSPVRALYENPSEAERVGQLIRQSADHRLMHHETELRNVSGEPVPILLAASYLYDDNNTLRGSVGFFEDQREVRRRESLLQALDTASRSIRPFKEPRLLLQEIVQVAVDLVGYTAGALYRVDAHREELEITHVFQLPTKLIGRRQPLDAGLAGEAYRHNKAVLLSLAYHSWLQDEPILAQSGLRTAVCLPLRGAVGEVIAILVVGDSTKHQDLREDDLDVLNRFAVNAALVLQTARLIDREERYDQRLRILNALGTFLQELRSRSRVAHALLTAITAGYGLGFNRAALLLPDTHSQVLRGLEGIGNFSVEEAARAWTRHHRDGREDFTVYCDLLGQGLFDGEISPLGRAMRQFSHPIDASADDLFNRMLAYSEQYPVRVRAGNSLPEHFVTLFQPDEHVVVVPLVVVGTTVGLLVVDNNITRFWMTDDDLDALAVFADTGAIVLENLRLFEQSQRTVSELSAMQNLADTLARGANDLALLDVIVRRARELLGADSAVIWSYDRASDSFLPEYSTQIGIDNNIWASIGQADPQKGGTIETVMSKGGLLAVTNVFDTERYPFIGQSTYRLCRAIGVHSFLAVALRNDDAPLGVLFINFRNVRMFAAEEEQTARAFASYATMLLKRAGLQSQLDRVRRGARMISQVTMLEDLQATLQLVARGLRDATSCDAVTVYEYNATYNQLRARPISDGLFFPDRSTRLPQIPQESLVFQMLQKRDIYVVEDTSSDPLFKHRRFVRDEQIKSCLVLPLRSNHEPSGVIFVNYRSLHRFSQEELEIVQLFADQAADAIRHVQMYQRERLRTDAFNALHQAAQSIAAAEDLDDILRVIAEQAFTLIAQVKPSVTFANIRILDGTIARFAAAHPPERLARNNGKRGHEIDLENISPTYRIGVTGRAIRHRRTEIVPSVREDKDYLETDPRTMSEIAVPIMAGNTVFGAINVESDRKNTFNENDKIILEGLASHAAIAINNARRFQEQEQIKDYVGSHQIMKWMNMVRDQWMHTLKREVGVSLGRVELVRREVERVHLAHLSSDLDELKASLAHISALPLAVPFESDQAVTWVPINDVLNTYLMRRWKHAFFEGNDLYCHFDNNLDRTTRVWVSPYWLQQAIEILIDNAVHAMRESGQAIRRVTVTTQREDGHVVIVVSDTGPGIPVEYHDDLFQKPVAKQAGSRGAGVGLVLARTFLQTFKGTIQHIPSASGTTMRVRLIAREQPSLNNTNSA